MVETKRMSEVAVQSRSGAGKGMARVNVEGRPIKVYHGFVLNYAVLFCWSKMIALPSVE